MVKTVCIAGKNEIAVRALLHVRDACADVELVACPNANDLGRSGWQPSLRRFADSYEIPCLTLDQLYSIENLVFISLEFDQIVDINRFLSDGLYNIHFSKLPAYKGMYTSAWPILNGESESGVTLHRLDNGIDTGPTIDFSGVKISSDTTARDLYFDYMDAAYRVFEKNLPLLLSGNSVAEHAQPAKGSTYFSRRSIDYSALKFNFNCTAEMLCRQTRAYRFREFQQPLIGGMRVGECMILPNRSVRKPGTVSAEADSLIVATIDYDVRIERDASWDWFTDDSSRLDELLASQSAIASINVPDKMGWTPLIKAAYAGDKVLCEKLLSAGASPNWPNPNGTTPVMYACSGLNEGLRRGVAELLVEFGAKIETQDYFGLTVTDYLRSRDEKALVSFIHSL